MRSLTGMGEQFPAAVIEFFVGYLALQEPISSK
jgi:hypothetical protein